MQPLGKGSCTFFTATLAIMLSDLSASASWPMCRHDPQRTGVASGTGNVARPTAYWKTYLGGAIGPDQLATAAFQGSGPQSLLLAPTGTFVATSPDGQQLWHTKALNVGSIVGVSDVNGDGSLDVVTYSNNQVYVLSSTGTVEWTEPAGQIGTMGGVRMGDVTGDGLPDIVIQECGCCGVTSGNPGFIYSFAQGFGSPTLVGTLPFNTCGSLTFTLVDATGNGTQEILLADYSHFALVGAGGSVLASTASLGTWIDGNECYTANVDHISGDEMICINNTSEAPGTNQRSITVLHYDPTSQPPALAVLWSKVVAPDDGGDMKWVAPVADLDGDGNFELVYATNDPTNGWETHIADALSGTELVTPIVSQVAAGTAALEQSGQLNVVTSASEQLTAWIFARSPSPTITNRWSIAGSALTYPAPTLIATQYDASNLVATDLNGDGLADLVVSAVAPSRGLIGFSGKGGQSTQVAALSLPADVSVLQAWVVPGLTTTVPQVALARTDGVLNLLDGSLNPTSSGGAPIAISFGGYYASGAWRELFHGPRLAPLDGTGRDAVLVDDSRMTLRRLDATTASLAIPPSTVWEASSTYGVAVEQGLDGGAPTIAALAIPQPVPTPPQYQAVALSAAGNALWTTVVSGPPLNDPMPADFNKDGVMDVSFQVGNPSNANLAVLAISGSNGAQLWATQASYPGAGGAAGVSLSDWNGDGVADVFFQGGATYVLSGADGSQLATGGPTNVYSIPLLYDTNGDGTDEVTLNAGFWPVTLYSHDLATALWTSPDDDKPYPYGAMVQCPAATSTAILVEGSWENPARLKLTPMGGTSLGDFSTIVLAGGQLYANEAAASAAGQFLGQLTAVNAHTNLTGNQHPTAVFGSSDGWLYGVNPCTGTLDFSVNIGSPVGEAVFGDTDGDGKDEILVTAADGYLYDFKDFSIDAPGYVYDTDPPAVTNHEVSSVVTTNRLSATWGAVANATSYEVQVVALDGGLVSIPPWQDAGTATAISLTGLPLQDDAKYLFAVRAVGPSGPSVDAISPGVVVHFPDGGVGPTDAGLEASADASLDASDGSLSPEASADATSDGGGESSAGGGGCSCHEASDGAASGTAGAIASALVALLSLRRRRSASH